jgi:hypothetical protein
MWHWLASNSPIVASFSAAVFYAIKYAVDHQDKPPKSPDQPPPEYPGPDWEDSDGKPW